MMIGKEDACPTSLAQDAKKKGIGPRREEVDAIPSGEN
jgi:hypothetical protein